MVRSRVLFVALFAFLCACGESSTPLGVCGNGLLDDGEACDDGNAVSGDGCNAACTSEEFCGNGVTDPQVGEQCDDGNVVAGDGCSATCVLESPEACGNGTVDAGETCDDGNTASGDGCSATCQTEADGVCGDGALDAGEECDDGNTNAGDGCDASCMTETPEGCGDGVRNGDEECDDGNTDAGDGCNGLCRLEGCGNGVLEPGEVCEDGNTEGGDGCSADCLSSEVCGNDILDVGEGCDDGNTTAGDGCSATCTVELDGTCGDGTLDPGEGCDDGNTADGDGCNAMCILETCGDGSVDSGEECDDGNDNNNDGCPITCRLATCGDTFVQAGVEECDDGARTAGDGCSPSCQLEICGNGVLDPGEACDDGNENDTDACASCALAVCGDGFVRAGVEACDDGNTTGGDGCSADCSSNEGCGNGILDPGEMCDDGNMDDRDACPGSCRPAACGDGYVQTGVEACDDGNTVSGDGCSDMCQFDSCGSGSVEGGEQCDEGSANGTPGSSCFESCLSTTVAFAAPLTWDLTASRPRYVEAADFNEDGVLDLAISQENHLSTRYGMGDGRFWGVHAHATANTVKEVVTVDVNGDGRADLLAVASTRLYVALGNGFGFDTPQETAVQLDGVSSTPHGLAVGRVDADAHLDVVVVSPFDDRVMVLLGDGAGGFTPDAAYSTRVDGGGDTPRSIALANVDADGDLDVVVSAAGSDDVVVMLNDGTGALTSAATYTTRFGAGGDEPWGLAVVDVSNDGHPDIVTANLQSDDITVLVGAGDGTFGTPLRFSTLDGSGGGDNPIDLEVADVTGDSVVDVVVACRTSDQVVVFEGMPAGASFAAPVFFSTRHGAAGSAPYAVAVADIDADGNADILTGNVSTRDVSVLLGTGGGAFAPARAYEGSPGTSGGSIETLAVADVTGEGDLDVVAGAGQNLVAVGGDGDGHLYPAQDLEFSSDLREVGLADIDGDGQMDFVVAGHNSSHRIFRGTQRESGDFLVSSTHAYSSGLGDDPAGIALGPLLSTRIDVLVLADFDRGFSRLLNPGTGAFNNRAYTSTGLSSTEDILLAEVTGDSALDAIIASAAGDLVEVRPGTGSGGFGSPRRHSTAMSTSGRRPVMVQVADLDGDTVADIFTANEGSNDVTVLRGLGSGSFEPPTIVPVTFTVGDAQVDSVRTGDFNGDMIPDLATANTARNTISVMLGFGDMNFSAPQSVAAGNDPTALLVEDFNGDGIDDMAVVDPLNARLTVLLGQGHP